MDFHNITTILPQVVEISSATAATFSIGATQRLALDLWSPSQGPKWILFAFTITKHHNNTRFSCCPTALNGITLFCRWEKLLFNIPSPLENPWPQWSLLQGQYKLRQTIFFQIYCNLCQPNWKQQKFNQSDIDQHHTHFIAKFCN